MTTELITGKAGTPHVSSDDIGVMQAGIIGYDTYLLKNNDGNYPAITLKDSNHATIPVMQLIVEGRYVRVTSAETATIDSGVSGQKRNDLICLKYTRDTNNIETASIVVLKGANTTGTPVDPTVPAGSIINASATAYAKLARISINGITPATPIMLTTQLTGMGDSQTHTWVQCLGTSYYTPTAKYNYRPLSVCRAGGLILLSGLIHAKGTVQANSSMGIQIPQGYRPEGKEILTMNQRLDTTGGECSANPDGTIIWGPYNESGNGNDMILSGVWPPQ